MDRALGIRDFATTQSHIFSFYYSSIIRLGFYDIAQQRYRNRPRYAKIQPAKLALRLIVLSVNSYQNLK